MTTTRGTGTTVTTTLESHIPTLHRFTVTQFQKMHESGVFLPDQRTQLIRGEIYSLPSVTTLETFSNETCAHHRAFRKLNTLLVRAYGDVADIAPQAPIIAANDSWLEADLSIVKFDCQNDPAYANDVLLAIEISDSTLKFDREKKLDAYARSGIPETWILNLNDHQLEVYRQPDGEQYLRLQIVKPETLIAPLFAPDVTLEWWRALPEVKADE